MMNSKLSAAAMVLLLGVGTVALVGPVPFASAQDQAPIQGDARHEPPSPTRHIEGHLAFLKTELKITPAQEPLWEKVAVVIRDGAQKAELAMQQMRAQRQNPQNVSALDRLEQRVSMEDARAAQMHALLDAARPLYASFSDEQKKAANELFMPHHDWGHGWGPR
jgi:hypothetical protein